MMNSEILSSKPSVNPVRDREDPRHAPASNGMKIPNWLVIAFLAVSFLGFLDATYLTVEHYLGAIPSCFITTGCEAVLTSEHSEFWGIPVALLGSIYYLSLFLLAILYLDTKREKVIRLAAFLSPVGFLASLYFVYLQLFVIKEICSYCAASALTSTILFILGLFIIIKLIRLGRFLERKQ